MENQIRSITNDQEIHAPASDGRRRLSLSRTLRNTFYVTRKSLITAAVLTAVLLAVILIFHRLFLDAESGGLLLTAAVALSLLTGLLTAAKIRISDRAARIINPVLFFLVPVASMCMAECLNGKFIYDFSYVSFLCNYVVYLILYAVVMVFSGSFKMPILIMTPIIFLFSFACSPRPHIPRDAARTDGFSYDIHRTCRSLKLLLQRYLHADSGRSHVSGYHGTRDPDDEDPLQTPRQPYSAPCRAAVYPRGHHTVLHDGCGCQPRYQANTRSSVRGYHNSGTVLNFFLNTRYLIVEKPSDYNAAQVTSIVEGVLAENQDDEGILASAKTIQELAAQRAEEEAQNAEENGTDTTDTEDANGTDTANNLQNGETGGNADPAAAAAGQNETDDGLGNGFDENGNPLPNTGLDTDLAVRGTSDIDQPAASARKKKDQAPNVICIMNETFSDLRVLGQLSTNQDYMPFTRSLTKNTIKGNLYMPVTGAGTSNSEFEFLTGNTMAFLAAGSNAYELYIKSQLPSLAYTLAAQNYSRTALHVYYRTSWQRDVNYPLLGFERYDSIESFIDNDAIDEYRNGNKSFSDFEDAVNEQYPGENVLLRRFVSDRFDYKLLEQMYEERDPSKPFFIFNVTMQNHGSYDSAYENFDQKIKLTSTEEYYPAANRYLSLIYESDQAFKELVEYFSNVDEPTIICMFGDHQPNIETEFVESLLGSDISDLSTEDNQKRFVTPFVIWANYNIEEGYVDKMSANYLSTLLLQVADLKTTKYNDYLSALYRYVPVIDSNGYITADDEYYTFDETSEYTDLLAGYEKVQYNNLFDTIGRHDELFYIPNDTAQQ